jgi:hypothetical protein
MTFLINPAYFVHIETILQTEFEDSDSDFEVRTTPVTDTTTCDVSTQTEMCEALELGVYILRTCPDPSIVSDFVRGFDQAQSLSAASISK